MKLVKKKIRRNTVVIHKKGTFYGRVIRVLPDGKIFWLCTGLHFHITDPANLEIPDYKGYPYERWDCKPTKRFVHMTTLKMLKKRACRYHREEAHNTPLDYEYIRHD